MNYHSVTKRKLERHIYWFKECVKELEWLRDATHKHNIEGTRLTHDGMTALEMKLNNILKGIYGADKILSRPDPLKILEKWDNYNNSHFLQPHPVFSDMIKAVRTNPDAVREQSIREGW